MCTSLPCNIEFNSWRATLRTARESNSLTKILATFQLIPNAEDLSYYRAKDPYLYLLSKMYVSGKSREFTTGSIQQGMDPRTMIEECIRNDDYSGLFRLIDLAVRQGQGLEISLTLSGLKGIASIQESRKSQSICAYDLTSLLEKPGEFVQALEAGQVEQGEFVKTAYALRDEHVDIVRKALPILYKNPSEIVTVKNQYNLGLLHWAISESPIRPKLVKCILEYGGCFNLLSLLSNESFSQFLHNASDEMLKWVSSESPEIFAFSDQTRDFLACSIQKDFFLNLQFFKTHLEQLKSTYNPDGIPLVLCADGQNEISLMMQVIQMDPTILQLKTKDGTPVINLFSHFFPPDSDEYEMGKQFLKQLGVNLEDLNK